MSEKKTHWAHQVDKLHEYLMSMDEEMTKLHESKCKQNEGKLTESEVFLMIFASSLEEVAEDLTNQYSATIEARGIVNTN
jgi:hypothetical protein